MKIVQYIKDQVFRHQKGHGSLQLVPQEINLQPYGEKENCHVFFIKFPSIKGTRDGMRSIPSHGRVKASILDRKSWDKNET